MIRHILKIIWNERRINIWLLLEYVLVFCLLWFCSDFLYTTAKTFLQPTGFDTEHTYQVVLSQKTGDAAQELPPEMDEYSMALTLMERLKRYPAIEAVSMSDRNSIPYNLSRNQRTVRIDTDSMFMFNVWDRRVSSGFFDVFRIDLSHSAQFDPQDEGSKNKLILVPDNKGNFGQTPVEQVHALGNYNQEPDRYRAIGYTTPLKSNPFDSYRPAVFFYLHRDNMRVQREISIRVRPEADHNFVEQFKKEMSEQLNIGNYYLSSVVSFEKKKQDAYYYSGTDNELNSIYSVTIFLIVNVFLGILGSFWFRTQSRRSEVGLRIALGASPGKVRSLLLGETLLLLSVAAIAGTLICLHIGSTDLIETIGIPYTDREEMGIGIEQDFINFGLTFGFLALVSVIAVSYPARQAARTQPAEVLHEE